MVRSYLAVAGMTVASLGFALLTNWQRQHGHHQLRLLNGRLHQRRRARGAAGSENDSPRRRHGERHLRHQGKLYLEATRDPDSTPDKVQRRWKNYDYDIDGDISTATSTNLCKVAAGANAQERLPRRRTASTTRSAS